MPMRLDQFPRPRGDTGIGFHYYPDVTHFDRQSLSYWLAELKDLGASWLVLRSTLDETVPEYFVRELISAHVEPVVGIDVWPLQSVDRAVLSTVCRQYAAWGVYYVYLYREPNRASQWRVEDWSPPGLVGRFARMLFPAMESIYTAGLFPLLSPLAPGGSYWDLTFLRELLDLLATDGRAHLLDRLGICIHNPASNRPLVWGKGGPDRWSLVRPYDSPPGSQDHRGFHLFEWYDALIRERLGQSLPMLCGATSLIPGSQTDPAFPALDEMAHGQRCVEIARLVMGGEVPDYLFNVTFWALAAGDSEPSETHAWYKRDTSTLPAVDALKRLKKQPRRFRWSAANRPDLGQDSHHPIYHYVLFASSTTSASGSRSARWMVPAAVEYIDHFRPAIGFTVEEARRASRVTVIGPDLETTAAIEAALASAGCLVEPIVAQSEDALRQALGDLVRRGRRFRQLPG